MRKRTTQVMLVVLLVLLPAVTAWAQTTIVLVNPPSQSVDVGQTVTVEIKADAVTSLYGVDIRLSFDAAKLEAQDADGNSANGVQMAPGNLMDPAQGFLAQNSVNNTTGQAQYVFALMSPASPASGTGVLASITFRATAAGNAVISLDSVTLSDEQAQPIPATLMNGSITVLPVGGPTATPTATSTGVPPTATPTGTVTPTPGGFYYTVTWGDTLYSLARRFGVTVAAIVQANNLANPNYIRVGQVLWIPGQGAPPTPVSPVTHVVQPGDNLYRISLRYGVSVQAIAAANGIVNPWYIRVGQVLIIPTGGPPPPPPGQIYVVRPGDTVYGIALRFGVSMWDIVSLNNLANPNLIFVGQVLRIP